MDMSPKEYQAYVQSKAKKSPIVKDTVLAFIIGGAGTLVPITGFANSVVSPAIDFKSEGFITGMAAKMFTVAGPVIVFGTLASVLYGVVLMFMG